MYLNGAFCGDAGSISRLTEHFNVPYEQILQKTLASLEFRYSYWDTAYGELGTYEMDPIKQKVTSVLTTHGILTPIQRLFP